MTIESLDLADIQQAARHAWRLVIAYPWRLIGCVLLVLCVDFGVASLLPHVAYLAHVAVGVVLFAQALLLFRSAERGEKPSVFTLFQALALPLSSQMVLVLCEWLTDAVALAYVADSGGSEAVRKFFGQPFAWLTLDPLLYRKFVLVQFVVNAATTFVAPAIVLAGIHGIAAIPPALQALARNLMFVLLLLCIDLGLEFALHRLGELASISPWLALALNLSLQVPVQVFELALLYAASLRVFGLRP